MPHRRPIFLFLALCLLFSTPFYLLLNLAGGRGEGMRLFVTGLMWCPALAALLACRISGSSIAALGWRWPARRLAWLCYLLPLGYGIAVYALVWGSGLGAFSTQVYEPMASKAMGLANWPPGARIALMIALQASVGFVLSCTAALGEEIGWRGFLAPRLVARFGFGAGSVATGLAWAAWHVPVLFFANYGDETPRAFAITCFTLSLVAMSFVYSWFRLRSGSLWTAVLLHASHNTFITPVFSFLTADTGRTAWVIDEFGLGLVLATGLLAIYYARRRQQALDPAREELASLNQATHPGGRVV